MQYLFNKYLMLYVQSWTPDDGRKDRPKHVECHSKKNEFDTLVHLVGFTIGIISFWYSRCIKTSNIVGVSTLVKKFSHFSWSHVTLYFLQRHWATRETSSITQEKVLILQTVVQVLLHRICSRHSSVSIVMWLWAAWSMVHIQAGPTGFSFLQNILTRFKTHPASY